MSEQSDTERTGRTERATDDRLDQLGERIERAHGQAEEALGRPDETYHESGETEAQDDQTITPPG